MAQTGRKVVITGASSGFGERTVRAFAGRGCRVWGTMRDTDARNVSKKAALEAHSPKTFVVEMDIVSDAAVWRTFRRAFDQRRGARPARLSAWPGASTRSTHRPNPYRTRS